MPLEVVGRSIVREENVSYLKVGRRSSLRGRFPEGTSSGGRSKKTRILALPSVRRALSLSSNPIDRSGRRSGKHLRRLLTPR
mmetsp:Transcript_25619/g.82981  ORF Transcript_25619/g.82981 Transcript_25619/m.82981 type:complete len:82 (+) Transcript_25619:842-1087(+)